MQRVLLIDNSVRDARRFQGLLAKECIEVEFCSSGVEAEKLLSSPADDFGVAIILWELTGQVSGADLLLKCRKMKPEMPVVVTSESLDASLATRAFAFGARDFLAKPLDSERIISCMRLLLNAQDPLSPLVKTIRGQILGESAALINTLKQIAKVIPHRRTRVLLIGESGTGKDLFAQAIHRLGPNAEEPWVPVNISGIPPTLIESALFGHEKGAFTGAISQHAGYLEEAGEGTIFLDEIGDLDLLLQTKLLRVIQERRFRRLGGNSDLHFRARLVCATNRDLAAAVNQDSFRRDMFHRIAEVTIQVPPLRERKGDIDVLLNHFLDKHRGDRQIRFARETLAILRSYPFHGNVRELENLVTSALIESEGAEILPGHLPLKNMGTLLAGDLLNQGQPHTKRVSDITDVKAPHNELVEELLESLPASWSDLPYRNVAHHFNQALDRVYLRHKLERSHHNIAKAARDAGIDSKTFRKRWKDCGLPPLSAAEDQDAD
jgi:DNA-binding NtrC family response regulator